MRLEFCEFPEGARIFSGFGSKGLYDVVLAPVPADAACGECGVSLVCRSQSEAIVAFLVATVEDNVCYGSGTHCDGYFCCCGTGLCIATGLHILDIELAVACVFKLPETGIVQCAHSEFVAAVVLDIDVVVVAV